MPNIFSKATRTITHTVSQIVVAGENLVIGKPPGRRTSSHGASSRSLLPQVLSPGHLKKTASLRSLTRRSSSKATTRRCPKAKDLDVNPPENVHIYCSNMYTHDFVTEALTAVEKDNQVCSLELEDLIQRNDPDVTKAVVDLLVNNALATSSNNHSKRRANHSRRNGTKRNWTQIVFVDCISDAESYKEYLNLKMIFQTKMRRRLALKGVKEDVMPIRFEAKIELHTLLDVMGVIQLLQAVERDSTVQQVLFHGYACGREADIPDIFASMADPETMQWKQSTEILLRYRRRPKDLGDQANPATVLVRKCSQALEAVVFGASMRLDPDLELTDPAPSKKLAIKVKRRGALQKDDGSGPMFESDRSLNTSATHNKKKLERRAALQKDDESGRTVSTVSMFESDRSLNTSSWSRCSGRSGSRRSSQRSWKSTAGSCNRESPLTTLCTQ